MKKNKINKNKTNKRINLSKPKKNKIQTIQYSFIDIYYLLKEIISEGIQGAKIEKVYQPQKDEIILQLFFINKQGAKQKKFLFLKNNILFLGGKKPKTDRPPSFCEYLRKKITNFKIKRISQLQSDRIVSLELEGKINDNNKTKSKTYFLILEMFGKGNIILLEKSQYKKQNKQNKDNKCNGDGNKSNKNNKDDENNENNEGYKEGEYTIKNQIRTQKTKDRVIKPNEFYYLPPKDFDLLKDIKKDNSALISNFKKIIQNKLKTNKHENENNTTFVHFIATDLNFGGKYSDEICFLSGIDKSKQIDELTTKDFEKLINVMKSILNKKISPVIYTKQDTQQKQQKQDEHILFIAPFELKNLVEYNKESNKKEAPKYIAQKFNGTFNELLEFVNMKNENKENRVKLNSKYSKKLKKIENIIRIQQKQFLKNKEEGEKNQLIGEKIYENYQVIDDFLKDLNKVREQKGWAGVEKTIKGDSFKKKHKKINIISVDSKKGKVIIEML